MTDFIYRGVRQAKISPRIARCRVYRGAVFCGDA